MYIVNIQDVRISQIADAKNPDRQISVLDYHDRQYELVQTFFSGELQAAQGLCRHFDEQGTGCVIVKNTQQYSVWMERNIDFRQSSAPPQERLESVFRAQLCLFDGLWTEVGELLGAERATAFGTEILASIPSVRSITYLSATIMAAKQPDRSLELSTLTASQVAKLYLEIQRLGRKYLGKDYANELLIDLQNRLLPHLKPEFQRWLKKQ
jgi:hypothetical protein